MMAADDQRIRIEDLIATIDDVIDAIKSVEHDALRDLAFVKRQLRAMRKRIN